MALIITKSAIGSEVKMMIDLPRYKCYEAQLTPCPRCGSTRHEITGLYSPASERWYWTIKCKSCPDTIPDMDSEYSARKAYERRYKENETKQEVKQQEVEQDGDITWSFFYLWKQCAQRYAEECLGRLDGADRSDTDLG